MRSLILLVPFLVMACSSVSGQVSEFTTDAGPESSLPSKTCRIDNAKYQVTFTKVSGDCPQADATSFVWVGNDGKPQLPSNCTDYSKYTACSTFQLEQCRTWVYDEWISGELQYLPTGYSAQGDMTFTAYNLNDGSLNCSSVYHVDYEYQWQSQQ